MGGTEKNAIYIIVFAVIVGGMAHAMKRSLTSEHNHPHLIPVDIGSWKGRNIDCDVHRLKAFIGAQDVVFRSYGNGMDVIVLYMAFYKDVDSADSVHAPEVCFAGQGWMIAEDNIVQRRLGKARASVNRMVIQKAGEQELVYNWWQTGRKIIPRNSINRFYQMFLSITGHNPSTIWVRMSKIMKEDPRREEQSMIRFCGDLMPFMDDSGRNDNETPHHLGR
jgi:EpsI family protein